MREFWNKIGWPYQVSAMVFLMIAFVYSVFSRVISPVAELREDLKIAEENRAGLMYSYEAYKSQKQVDLEREMTDDDPHQRLFVITSRLVDDMDGEILSYRSPHIIRRDNGEWHYVRMTIKAPYESSMRILDSVDLLFQPSEMRSISQKQIKPYTGRPWIETEVLIAYQVQL